VLIDELRKMDSNQEQFWSTMLCSFPCSTRMSSVQQYQLKTVTLSPRFPRIICHYIESLMNIWRFCASCGSCWCFASESDFRKCIQIHDQCPFNLRSSTPPCRPAMTLFESIVFKTHCWKLPHLLWQRVDAINLWEPTMCDATIASTLSCYRIPVSSSFTSPSFHHKVISHDDQTNPKKLCRFRLVSKSSLFCQFSGSPTSTSRSRLPNFLLANVTSLVQGVQVPP
jgi:hypothetical protein